MPLHFSYVGDESGLFVTRFFVNLASLSHDFLSVVDFAICGLLVFAGSAFVDLSLTRGGQEN
jgi:hypothetical protein